MTDDTGRALETRPSRSCAQSDSPARWPFGMTGLDARWASDPPLGANRHRRRLGCRSCRTLAHASSCAHRIPPSEPGRFGRRACLCWARHRRIVGFLIEPNTYEPKARTPANRNAIRGGPPRIGSLGDDRTPTSATNPPGDEVGPLGLVRPGGQDGDTVPRLIGKRVAIISTVPKARRWAPGTVRQFIVGCAFDLESSPNRRVGHVVTVGTLLSSPARRFAWPFARSLAALVAACMPSRGLGSAVRTNTEVCSSFVMADSPSPISPPSLIDRRHGASLPSHSE